MTTFMLEKRSISALRSMNRLRATPSTTARHSSTAEPDNDSTKEDINPNASDKVARDPTKSDPNAKPKKSVLQQDEELRQKMSGLSGDGGDAGVELEDGKPVSMKRSVKNNMFRYI